MDTVIVPALERFRPDLIVVACGFDASDVDPLARMLLHSESFRAMTATIRETAERLCDGRLVMVHEGSYADTYVPFCGHAVIEELAGCALKWLIRFCLCWKGSNQIQYFVLFSVRQSAGWQYIYCVKKVGGKEE